MKTVYLTFCLTLLFLSCQKEKVIERTYPRIETLSVSDITEKGAKFNANIISTGSSEILAYGFIWNEISDFNYDNSERYLLSSKAVPGLISQMICTRLKENTTYYVKSYLKADEFLVYGNVVEFDSKGSGSPTLRNYYPKQGSVLDTVWIEGDQFSNKIGSNSVKFASKDARILSATNTVLKVLVPGKLKLDSCEISVSIEQHSERFYPYFKLEDYNIYDIDPLFATFGDTLRINGENLPENDAFIFFHVGNVSGDVIEANGNEIKCIVPSGIADSVSELSLYFDDSKVNLNKKLKLIPPEIKSIIPLEVGGTDDLIYIHGDYFDPESLYNKVIINDYFEATIHSATRYEIACSLPESVITNQDISQKDTLKITVTVAKQKSKSKNINLNYRSRWTRCADFPGEPRIWPVSFEYKGKGYFGMGSAGFPNYYLYENHFSDLWAFDPDNDSWEKVTDFPPGPRGRVACFLLGSKLYVCCGLEGSNKYPSNVKKDVWEYDLEKDLWTQKNDFPGTQRYMPFYFKLNGKAYMGGGMKVYGDHGILRDFWQYNPVHDEWTEMGVIPEVTSWDVGYGLTAFSDGDYGYMGFGRRSSNYMNNTLWRYNDVENNWTQLAQFPVDAYRAIGFQINKTLYVGLPEKLNQYKATNDFYAYDIAENTWKNIGFAPLQRLFAGTFTIGNKGFICGGMYNVGGTAHPYDANMVDLWMFDPGK